MPTLTVKSDLSITTTVKLADGEVIASAHADIDGGAFRLVVKDDAGNTAGVYMSLSDARTVVDVLESLLENTVDSA